MGLVGVVVRDGDRIIASSGNNWTRGSALITVRADATQSIQVDPAARRRYSSGCIVGRHLYLVEALFEHSQSSNAIDVYDLESSKPEPHATWAEIFRNNWGPRELLAGTQFTRWTQVSCGDRSAIVSAGKRGFFVFPNPREAPLLQDVGGECLDVVAFGDHALALINRRSGPMLVRYRINEAGALVERASAPLDRNFDRILAVRPSDSQ